MQPFIPREKMSKKGKRALNLSRRRGWEETNPVTKTIESKKIYKRKKPSNRYEDDGTRVFLLRFGYAAGSNWLL